MKVGHPHLLRSCSKAQDIHLCPLTPPHPHFTLDVLNAIAVLRQENFVGRVSVYETGMSEERNNAVEALATDGSPRSLAMTVTR